MEIVNIKERERVLGQNKGVSIKRMMNSVCICHLSLLCGFLLLLLCDQITAACCLDNMSPGLCDSNR